MHSKFNINKINAHDWPCTTAFIYNLDHSNKPTTFYTKKLSSTSIFPEKHSLPGYFATKKVGDRPILQNTACKTCINKQEEKVVPNHHIIVIIYVKFGT
jgi:hypothetical protein